MSLLDEFHIRGVFRTGDGVTRQVEDVDYLVPDEELPEVARQPPGPRSKRPDNMWQHRRAKKAHG